MRFKTIFTMTCVLSSMGASSYFAYQYGQSNQYGKSNETESINYHSQEDKHAKELQDEVNRLKMIIKSKKRSPREEYILNAINRYGLDDVMAMAINGRYECPSAKEQKVDRCDPREEISVMFATLNLAKADKRTVARTVYYKLPNGGPYLFSWVPKIGKGNEDRASPIFKHSLELAYQVLGGNPEYEQYNYNQEFYCRESISKCVWHNNSKNLSYLGRINLSNQEVKGYYIKEKELSFHTFWSRK